LREVFEEDDSIVVEPRIIMDLVTDRTKGFGFVTFSDIAAVERALNKDGQLLKGRAIRVGRVTTSKRNLQPRPARQFTEHEINQIQSTLNDLSVSGSYCPVNWYLQYGIGVQADILKVSKEGKESAKVVWVGNLHPQTTRILA
jgi:RNA recognition motif-containing protein